MTTLDPANFLRKVPSANPRSATQGFFGGPPRPGQLLTTQGPQDPPQNPPVRRRATTAFQDFIDQAKQERDRALMMSYTQAVRANPDLAGEAHELGIKLDRDSLMVEQNIERVRALVQEQDFIANRDNLSPVTRRQLEDPEFARIAYDDIDAMNFFEKVVNTFSEVQTVALAMTGFGPTLITESTIGKRFTVRKLQTEQALLGMKQLHNVLSPGPLHPPLTRDEEARIAEINEQIQGMPTEAQGFVSGFAGFLGQQAAVIDQVAAMAAIGAGAGASIGLAGGPAAPVTSTAGAIVGFGAGMTAAIATTTHDIEGGAKFLELVEQGVNPKIAARIASNVAIMNASLEVAGGLILAAPVISAVRNTLGREVTKQLLRTTTPRAVGNFVRDWGLSVGGEALTEGAQEVVGFRADIAAGVDPGDFAERVLGAMQESIFEVTLIGGFGATVKLASDLGQVQRVEQTQAVFSELTGAGRSTQVLGRSPGMFRGFAQAATGGRPVDRLYIAADRFVEAMEETGFTREQLAQALPEIAANLDELVASKGDVVVEVAEYAAQVSPFQQLDAALQRDMRFNDDANAKTIRMAEQERQDQKEMVENTAKEVESLVKKDRAFARSLRKVNDRILEEIKETGVIRSARQRRDAATIRSNVIGTLTVQMNKVREATGEKPLTPEEVDTLFRGRVVGAAEAPSGVQLSQDDLDAIQDLATGRQVDAETRTSLEARGFVEPQAPPTAAPVEGEPGAAPVETSPVEPAELTDAGRRVLEPEGQREPVELAAGDVEGQRGGFIPETLLTILYEKADFSTFAHETAHYYIEVLTRIVTMPGAPEQLVEDMQTFLDWAGVKDLETWGAMSTEQQRKAQEAFAYQFEVYLFDGKSPTLALEGFFSRMRSFLINLYTDIRTTMNATYREEFGEELPILTGEVRGIMDRMLATEAAIEDAEAARGMAPLFETRESFQGTDAQWLAYQQGAEATGEEALTELLARSLGDMQWLSRAEGRRVREIQQKRKRARDKIEGEVREQVALEPVYRALRYIRTGELVNDEGTVAPKVKGITRLNTDAVRSIAPDADLVAAAITSPKGIDPDTLADSTGFNSGEELVNAVLTARPFEEVVSERTDVRMSAENAELVDPQAIKDAIQESLHNEARARFTATSLQALTKGRQPVRLMVKAARSVAQNLLSAMPIAQIKAWRFHGAEARANKAARTALGKGDIQEAIRQTRAELLQHELARLAAEVDKEVTKAEARFKRFYRTDAKIGKDRDMDLVRAGRFMLASLGYAPPAEEGQQAELTAESMQILAKDFPTLSDRVRVLTDKFGGKDFRDMPLSAFREVDDTAKSLWETAREANLVDMEGQKLEMQMVSGELQERIRAQPSRTAPGSKTSSKITPSGFARTILTGWNQFASLKRLQHWVRFMDGGKARGPFERFILNPMMRALDAYRTKNAEVLDRLHPMLMKIARDAGNEWDANIASTPDELKGKVFRGKKDLIGMLLHAGSFSNLEKLLVGNEWAADPRETDGVLITAGWDRFLKRMFDEGKLTEADVQFVVAVWEEFDKLLPMAQKTHRKLYGYEFEAIKLKELKTPFGTFKGGYAPARVDYAQTEAPNTRANMDSLQNLEDNFQYSISTGRGFTITRNPNFHKPLQIDVSRIIGHFDDELRFIFLQPVVRNVVKIARDKGFEQVMNSYDREAINRIILPWLDNTSRQKTFERSDSPLMDAALRIGRNRGGLVALGLNYSNAAIQLTGIATGRTQVKAKHFRAGVWMFLRNPIESWRQASAESIRMRERSNLHTRNQQEDIRKMFFGKVGRAFAATSDVGARWAFFPQRIMQGIVDVSIWHGAKQQSVAEAPVDQDMNTTQANAVIDADNAVERSQGSGNPESLASYESGNALSRVFLQFTSYSNGVLNQILGGQTRNERVERFLWTIVVVGAAETLLRMPFEGTPEDEDDDGEYLDDWAKLLGMRILRNAQGLIPLGGAIMSFAEGESDRIASSPAAGALGAAARGLGLIGDIGDEDETFTGRDAKDLFTLLTVLTGLPLTPIGKSLGFAVDVEAGRVDPRGDVDYIRGLLTGRSAAGTRR